MNTTNYYTDAHCHITDIQIAPIACISNAARISDWDKIMTLTRTSMNFYGAIGIHPWYCTDTPDSWESEMRTFLDANPKIMVGEIGLDKNHPAPDVQTDIFMRQLKIAAEYKRVAHIHCVGAWDNILHILGTNPSIVPPIIIAHGFSGTREIIAQAIKYNIYFSYGPGPHTIGTRFKNAVLCTPPDRILIESDTNTPQDQQKKLDAIIDTLAKIYTTNPYKILTQTHQNFTRILNNV